MEMDWNIDLPSSAIWTYSTIHGMLTGKAAQVRFVKTLKSEEWDAGTEYYGADLKMWVLFCTLCAQKLFKVNDLDLKLLSAFF